MKKLSSTYKFIVLAIAILFSINEIKAQCEISVDTPLPVCYQTVVKLEVNIPTNNRFVWIQGNDTIHDGQLNNIFERIIADNTLYSLDVYDLDGNFYCHGEKIITMKPTFDIRFEQLSLTCSDKNDDNGKTGKMRATASGANSTNFTYHWNAPILPIQYMDDPQVAIGLSAYTPYTITVTNEDNGCVQTFDVDTLKAYPNPKVDIFSDPSDTVFLDNPYVKWGYTQTDSITEISNFFWQFDGYEGTFTDEHPVVTFSEEGIGGAQLTVLNEYGCDTTYTSRINVCAVRLKVPNIFTPNHDGINDYFEIGCLDQSGKVMPLYDLNEYFVSHKLVIFNRWGKIVYESTDYKNDWDGGKLPDGTYFYVLDCKGKTQNYNYKGSVMIWNSGR